MKYERERMEAIGCANTGCEDNQADMCMRCGLGTCGGEPYAQVCSHYRPERRIKRIRRKNKIVL